MPEISIEITDEAMADLHALPNKDLQRAALQWIHRLRRHPRLGQELVWRLGQDLRGCRKIYLDQADRPLEFDLIDRRHSEDDRAAYRIVYRLLPNDDRPRIAQVFAVGLKYDDGSGTGGVYQNAADRYRLLLDD